MIHQVGLLTENKAIIPRKVKTNLTFTEFVGWNPFQLLLRQTIFSQPLSVLYTTYNLNAKRQSLNMHGAEPPPLRKVLKGLEPIKKMCLMYNNMLNKH